MDNYTEQDIRKKLDRLASIEPDKASLQRMNRRVYKILDSAGEHSAPIRSFVYYALTSAAVFMIGVSFLHINPGRTRQNRDWAMPAKPTLTLAQLNAVFENGGQKALDEYLDKVEIKRQPRAESITLQEMLKEL